MPTSTDFDLSPSTNRTAAIARKSDTFLHYKPSQRAEVPDLHHCRPPFKESNSSTDAATRQVIRDRLSRMFDDNDDDDVVPRRRKSTDVVSTLGRRTELYGRVNTTDDNLDLDTSNHQAGSATARDLPQKQVPDRRSSLATSQQANLQDFPSWRLPPPSAAGKLIPSRGRADSPVKRSIAKESISSDALRPMPSRTFVRSSPPLLLLDYGSVAHKRVGMSIGLNAPLFLGGGTIEGNVKITIDHNLPRQTTEKSLLISKLSVDVVGLEVTGNGRK